MLRNNNKPPLHPVRSSTTTLFSRLDPATQVMLYNTWQTLKQLLTDARVKFENLNNGQDVENCQRAKTFALGLHRYATFDDFKAAFNPSPLSALNPFPLLVSYRKHFPEHTLAEQLLNDPRHAQPLMVCLSAFIACGFEQQMLNVLVRINQIKMPLEEIPFNQTCALENYSTELFSTLTPLHCHKLISQLIERDVSMTQNLLKLLLKQSNVEQTQITLYQSNDQGLRLADHFAKSLYSQRIFNAWQKIQPPSTSPTSVTQLNAHENLPCATNQATASQTHTHKTALAPTIEILSEHAPKLQKTEPL